MFLHQHATELQRISAGRRRHFFHEALQVQAVLVGVDTTPSADRHMGVAHCVLGAQTWYGVAKLCVTRRSREALQLA